MPIAKVPIYSLPTDSVYFEEELDMDFSISSFDVRKYIGLELELNVEDQKFSAGTSDFVDISSEIGIDDYLFHFYLNPINFYDEVDVELTQNYTEQLLAVQAVDNSDAIGRIDNIESELSLTSTNPQFYKEFSYTDGVLGGYTVYSDISKSTPIFIVSFAIVDGVLTSKTVLRVSDNRTLIVQYWYDQDGNLTSQTRIIS